MDVTVCPLKANCVITRQEVDAGIYQIRVDGRQVGFVGYQDGAHISLLKKYSPLEIREIERAVRIALTPQKISCTLTPTQPPPTPPAEDYGDYL